MFANLLDEANVKTAIAHPLSVIASAGAGYDLSKINSISDLPHPKSFGAFPRFLRKYIKENRLSSFEQAIEKITSKPAKLLSIGRIAPVKNLEVLIRAILELKNKYSILAFPRIE